LAARAEHFIEVPPQIPEHVHSQFDVDVLSVTPGLLSNRPEEQRVESSGSWTNILPFAAPQTPGTEEQLVTAVAEVPRDASYAALQAVSLAPQPGRIAFGFAAKYA